MSQRESTAYDAVTYPGSPFSQTHPDRLATIAALYGLPAAPPERCRVLELGCGNGGNLIPMAYVLPGSTFLGLDAAGSAVAQGREQISALGLTNVTLLHADLLDASNPRKVLPGRTYAIGMRLPPFPQPSSSTRQRSGGAAGRPYSAAIVARRSGWV